MLTEEMTGILIWAVVVVIIVMLISTKGYILIPVLFLTFGVAVLLNMGTNYWFGEVSFITKRGGGGAAAGPFHRLRDHSLGPVYGGT